jgi:hypothetical protein
VCVDNLSLLKGKINAIKKDTETSVSASEEVDLDVNAYKIEWALLLNDRNPGHNHYIQVTANALKMFHIWKTDKQQNYIYEEVDEIWRLLDCCAVQSLLFFCFNLAT